MKILIVVDMQRDFIDGTLGTKEAQAIVPKVKAKVEDYIQKGYTVVFTRDTHHSEYLSTQEGRKLPVEHCIINTDGWQICDELKPYAEHVFDKITFGHYDLPKYLPVGQNDEIELCGLCTDICVISNAMLMKSVYTENPIIVDASCCAGVTPETHKNALEAMKMCQIEIIGE